MMLYICSEMEAIDMLVQLKPYAKPKKRCGSDRMSDCLYILHFFIRLYIVSLSPCLSSVVLPHKD